MKKKFFYIAMVALALTGCSDSLSTIDSSEGKADITIPSDAEAGELLIKFAPEMSSILDQAQMSKTRSGKARLPVRVFLLPTRCSTSWEATASSVSSLLMQTPRLEPVRRDSTSGTP